MGIITDGFLILIMFPYTRCYIIILSWLLIVLRMMSVTRVILMDQLEKLKWMLIQIQEAQERDHYIRAATLGEAYIDAMIQEMEDALALVRREIALEDLVHDNAILTELKRHKERKHQQRTQPKPVIMTNTKKKRRSLKADMATVFPVLNQYGTLLTKEVADLADMPTKSARLALDGLRKDGIITSSYMNKLIPTKGLKWTIKEEHRKPLGVTIEKDMRD